MNEMRRNVTAAVMATALVAGSMLVTGAGTAQARDGDGAAADTDSAIVAAAAKAAPLTALADALGEQGRSDAYAGIYGNLSVDEGAGTVTLYVTDLRDGQKLIAAAKGAHPGIDSGLAKLASAKYAKKDLDAQADRLIELGASGVTAGSVYSVAVNPDGSGLTVAGKSDKLDSIRSAIATGFAADLTAAPVTVQAGDPVTAASWRWNDSAPFIGGDVLVGSAHSGGTSLCTSGLVLDGANGGDLVTAAHCFRQGTDVYGEGDSVGDFYGTHGHKIGHVVNTNPYWDAQVIEVPGSNGSGTASDEADQPAGRWYRVKGVSYSYNGQSVCQDGTHSYYSGHGVPCGIKVQNDDVRYRLAWDDGSVHTVRGVMGHNANWAVTEGDSGALVFSVTNGTDRRARGIVSGQSGNTNLYWTEAQDIINAMGVGLNPRT
ncbi:hypothetical protein ACGF07_03170 [Kitasatospora sp. NPDC048194]|uniref:hypothetical protein n=1 Tax=Kitasatospora sp. NPDC048194 TaxID=3364045 RepID=UPI00371ABCB7